MKFNALLFLLVALLYLSYPVLSDGCGSNWLGNDAVGNDPDFNYASRVNSDGQTQATTGVASTSSDDRPRIPPDERKASTSASAGPNMSMPEPNPKPLVQAENNTTDASTAVTNAGSEAVEAPDPETISVDGKWTVRLGESGSYLDLIFIQSGDSVMGSGTLSEGSSEIPVIVSASLDGNELGLDVKSSVPAYEGNVNKEYKIDLLMANQTLSGSYEAYDNNKLVSKGNATASRTA